MLCNHLYSLCLVNNLWLSCMNVCVLGDGIYSRKEFECSY